MPGTTNVADSLRRTPGDLVDKRLALLSTEIRAQRISLALEAAAVLSICTKLV